MLPKKELMRYASKDMRNDVMRNYIEIATNAKNNAMLELAEQMYIMLDENKVEVFEIPTEDIRRIFCLTDDDRKDGAVFAKVTKIRRIDDFQTIYIECEDESGNEYVEDYIFVTLEDMEDLFWTMVRYFDNQK